MSELEPGYCHGDYSLWNNAVRMGSGGSETAKMMPEGWGQPGETRSGTIHRNASEGLWLPLYIPEGCDGHLGAIDPDTKEVLPEVIFYATPVVASQFDQQFGPAHSSEEVDAQRFARATELALEAGKSTSGSVYVREAQ